MKLLHDPAQSSEFQFSVEPYSAGAKAALDAIRNWHSHTELVEFARLRHGYGNSDGHFGITYPGDLDDCDRANGHSIPAGSVEACAWYGATDGETHLLSEFDYLDLLRQYLEFRGAPDLAARIGLLQHEIRGSV